MIKTSLIAIVDDDDAILTGLSSLLRSVDYEVRLFRSGEDFLAHAQSSPPNCVITDVQMPGMNGLELQLAIRANYPLLPVIFITAFPEEAIRDQAMGAGAHDFFSKPFNAEGILKSLSNAISARE